MDSPFYVSPIADLAHWLSDGEIVAFDIGPDGCAFIVIKANPTPDFRGKAGASSHARLSDDRPSRCRVLSVRPDGEVSLDLTLPELNFDVHYVQPLDNRLLLVSTRAWYRGPGDFERNAHILDCAGNMTGSISLGDGIASVQTNSSGTIWVSYFDEGVFGNRGWNEPLGALGLLAFSETGELLYSFVSPVGLDMICDWYALNVEFEGVAWCYYYTEFPLVRIRNFKAEAHWKMPLAGSHAFAVGNWHALFSGSYEQRNYYSLFSLTKERPVLIHEFELHTFEDEMIVADRTQGRGDSLWLQRGTEIFRVNIHEVIAHARKGN